MTAREHFTPDRAFGEGRGGLVAAEHPDGGRAGVQVLELGGNAVDAAVATAVAMCVARPQSATIAGSGYMLIARPGSEPDSVEFPARAPLAATPDMFRPLPNGGQDGLLGVSPVAGDANATGPLAPGVPAAVAGLCAAHREFGSLALDVVLEPARTLAEQGARVDPELQLALLAEVDALRDDPEARATLLDRRGLPPTVDFAYSPATGERPRLRQARLAGLIGLIAEQGADAIRCGPVAVELADGLQARGGILSAADLARYEPLVGPAASLEVGDSTVWFPRSPSGAWTVAQMLVGWAACASAGPAAVRVHRRVEMARHAFADRYVTHGDPDFTGTPLDRLLSVAHARATAAKVADDGAHPLFHEDSRPPWLRFAQASPDTPQTTHLGVVDREGTIVSCTITAAGAFGARVMCQGLLFDGAMAWFDPRPGSTNSIAPWKRPLANMSPMLVRRAHGATLAIGAPGGRRIISAVAQVAAGWIETADLEQALHEPRFDPSGRELLVSARTDEEVLSALADRGHPVRLVDDRDPFSYDLARPVAVEVAGDGTRRGGLHPYSTGYVGHVPG